MWQVILNGVPVIEKETKEEMLEAQLALMDLGVFGTFSHREVQCEDCSDHLLGCPVCTD